MTDPARLPAADALTFRWSSLARLGERPAEEGTGGELRRELADFQVEELPLYLPAGEGEHLMIHLRKEGHTTGHLLRELARQLRVKDRDIGSAGQKDRHAVTTQWVSVPAAAEKRLPHFALPGVEVLEAGRHTGKLGLGHLRGNRFRVEVRGAPGTAEQAAARLRELEAQGIPNYFGPQRFGLGGINAAEGVRVLRGESNLSDPRLRRFLVSALQSSVFNAYLSRRLERGLFAALLPGDRAKKHSSGGEFWVDSPAESERAARGEVSALGNLFGKKSQPLREEGGLLEQEALAALDLTPADFSTPLAGLRGDTRLTRIYFLEAPQLSPTPDGYTVQFALPRGSFATAVLRELMGGEVDTLPLPGEKEA
ncbi:tRNA pseudouridine synthase D [Deinococcus proteolyticus MRP]|uniref:tRNA pseudouridine synthase D n=1 Tax=Deinococcus proteolyticus (strain ATCC 35074 / DSM 20540 / JCM 6276 / NBRC 101906 / NCIMB 13154 / VKM Ac-1939 / CCM 2703 / MRP) TaxID=693977 RepID=F0RN74_DEIPM|nr:tRNA pseudouridine(13) synthase TruD [Deinococcus proteolyticus]ADY26216.1 tRNA pseudouridine synthase D [Deinococcus proteolyticus MRP]